MPLFVEEVTRLLLDLGEQGGIQAVPPTLQQSLSARLDRIGPAREVVQIGAVIGRDFSYSLLRFCVLPCRPHQVHVATPSATAGRETIAMTYVLS